MTTLRRCGVRCSRSSLRRATSGRWRWRGPAGVWSCGDGGVARPERLHAFVLALLLGMMPVAAEAKPADTLTVVTLNLWHDQHDWPSRLNVIVAELRRIRPDVVCLQEVLQHENLRNQAETLGTASAATCSSRAWTLPGRPSDTATRCSPRTACWCGGRATWRPPTTTVWSRT